jgi:DNA-3-methyladenine glycosylase
VVFCPLPQSFYGPSARIVAPRLLGHYLIRQTAEGAVGGPIVETEAYVTNDPACHAYVGETNRNRVMFGPPGHAYVYLIYGFYYCFNAVCCPPGRAEAVLIRAIEPQFGLEQMRRYRPVGELRQLTSGPGKLCVALNISRELDGVALWDEGSEVFIGKNPNLRSYRRQHGPIITSGRIGLTKAADWPLRYFLGKNAFVSGKKGRRR